MVIVTGSHRSGGTWVGRMLCESHELRYVDEPFNRNNPVTRLRTRPPRMYQYVCDANADDWHRDVAELLAGRFPILARAREIGSARGAYRFAREWARPWRDPLVKDPFAFFSAPWLNENFGLAPVIVLRHPAAFAASVQRLNWRFGFDSFTDQPLLMSHLLEPWAAEIVAPPDHILDRAALLWRCVYGTAMRFTAQHPGWLIVRHELLSDDPAGGFRDLYRRLGLTYDDAVARRIAAHTMRDRSDRTHEIMRDSRSAARRWRSELAPSQIDRLREQTADVDWYRDDRWWDP